MQYKIIDNPSYTSAVKVGISTEPASDSLRYFFSVLHIDSFSDYIEYTANDTGFEGDKFTYLLFFHEMKNKNKVGLDIHEGDLCIYNTSLDCECVMKSIEFKELLYDYASRIYSIYSYNKTLSRDWRKNMRTALQNLKKKIELESNNISV